MIYILNLAEGMSQCGREGRSRMFTVILRINGRLVPAACVDSDHFAQSRAMRHSKKSTCGRASHNEIFHRRADQEARKECRAVLPLGDGALIRCLHAVSSVAQLVSPTIKRGHGGKSINHTCCEAEGLGEMHQNWLNIELNP